MFKVGDRVRCIEASPFTIITLGEIYTISEIRLLSNNKEVVLLELPHQGSWRESRFELVQKLQVQTLAPNFYDQSIMSTINNIKDFYLEERVIPIIYGKIKKCECGAHKCGSNKHSDWYELYIKEKA